MEHFFPQENVEMTLDEVQKQTVSMDRSAMINLSRHNLFVGKFNDN